MKPDRRDLLAHLLLAAAIAVLAWPLVAGQVLYYGDLTLQFIPWRTFARAELLQGRVPLWLPETYLGMPFLGNDQSAVLYPWHWLSLAVSPLRQVALGCLVHLQLGASGMYCFARGRGRSRRASLLAALAFGLGGFCVSKQQFPSLAYTIAWLPWLAWSAQRLSRSDGRALLAAAVIVGLQWLAGHAQMSVMMLALVTGWQMLRPGGRGARRRWLGAVAWGTALAAAQWLPTFELLGWSARAGFSVADAARFNLPPWQLGQLALPASFGHPAGPLPYFGVGPIWETTWYLGLVTLPLAIAGGARGRAWLALAAVAVVLACGSYLPVYPALVRLVPGLTVFRDPARFTFYASFALALLAADGYDLAPHRAQRTALLLSGLMLLSALSAMLLPARVWTGMAEWVVAQAVTKQVADVARLAAGWRTELGSQAVLAAAVLGLVAGLLGGEARRLLPVLLAIELVLHGSGLNPTVAAAAFAADPRPATLRDEALIWVPPTELEAVATRCFNLAHYPAPPRVSEARASLAGNVLVGTGTAQVAGYDPLRPAAILAWLNQVEALPAVEREHLLAGLGCGGQWSEGVWTPFPAARTVARAQGAAAAHWLSPQRVTLTVSDGGQVEFTHQLLPGWRSLGGQRADRGSLPVAAWRLPGGAGRVRAWYAPLSCRTGLFLSLLAAGALAAAAVVTHRSDSRRDPISDPAVTMV